MHTAVLVILGAAFALVLACVLRFLQNTLLLGSKPPIFEDIPFVGGLITFIKVRGSVDSRRCAFWRADGAGWSVLCFSANGQQNP